MPLNNRPLRTVRSFVRRTGHSSKRQQQSLELYWQDYGLALTDKTYDFAAIFQRNAPLILEIGFGMGQSLIYMAQQYPVNNYIGIEVHRPGIGNVIAECQTHAIKNIRLFATDVVEVLQKSIADAALDIIQIFFPDPWPKRKHHKRRLIQVDFVQLLCKKLKAGGYIHLATDWQDYANHMSKVISNISALERLTDDHVIMPNVLKRQPTKFEKRGLAQGFHITDLIFRKP